jgi:hypothetical protein
LRDGGKIMYMCACTDVVVTSSSTLSMTRRIIIAFVWNERKELYVF